MPRKKISLIGAGNIGGMVAVYILQNSLADIVLLDKVEGLAKGKSLDLFHARALLESDVDITGGSDFSLTENSDIYIVSAGSVRRPGMNRDELLNENAEVIREVGNQIKKYSPQAIVIVITNPLDAMTQYMKVITDFIRNRVMGMAGLLDSCRLRAFLAQQLRVSVKDVQALVLGAHGESMVPLRGYSTVGGVPVSSLLDISSWEEIVKRVKGAGGEIVGLLKTSSAYYSPAISTYKMVEAILKDQKRVFVCSSYLEGEYGIEGYCMGVPVVLGARGIENIIEVEFTPEEKKAFEESFEACRKNIDFLRRRGFL